MREHPIPQDIVGYKFHIIGNMTLKQFAELGAGALLAVVLYSTNLVTPLKWLLICISIGTGAAAAFLPIEERPLDHWILAFIRTMYRPTKFYWQRAQKIPELFMHSSSTQQAADPIIDMSPARQARIREYLASVQDDSVEDPFSKDEELWLQEIMNAFQTVQPTRVEVIEQNHKPELTVRVRSLQKPLSLETSTVVFDQKQRDPILTKARKSVEEVAPTLAVPQTEAIEVEKQAVVEETAEQIAAQSAYVHSDDTQDSQSAVAADQSAIFNASLPFPSKPTEPNKIVGMILRPNNELIPDAIVQVQDESNRVVRAVKSNALGQFFITTPLRRGAYTLSVEHDHYQFPVLQITLQDQTVDPIEVRSLG